VLRYASVQSVGLLTPRVSDRLSVRQHRRTQQRSHDITLIKAFSRGLVATGRPTPTGEWPPPVWKGASFRRWLIPDSGRTETRSDRPSALSRLSVRRNTTLNREQADVSRRSPTAYVLTRRRVAPPEASPGCPHSAVRGTFSTVSTSNLVQVSAPRRLAAASFWWRRDRAALPLGRGLLQLAIGRPRG
jgi:hypothetical protein